MPTLYCNYGTLTGPCASEVEKPDDPCPIHSHSRYTVCANCGGTAGRLCTIEISPGARCGEPLCENCVHGQTGHQRIDEVPDAFTGSPQHPRVQQQRQDVRDQLVRITTDTLAKLQDQGALSVQADADVERLAEVIVNDLGVHALAGLLMGLAVTR